MYFTESKLHVQYYETDQMGIVHHSNYIRYYETGRNDFIRSLGMTYRQLEESGIIMPIITVSSKYIRPAKYDDVLTVRTLIKELPASRITFFYEIYNAEGVVINEGCTVLAFLNEKTRRPCRAPQQLMERLSPLFPDHS